MTLKTNASDIIKVNVDSTLIQKVIMDHTQIFESRKKSALEWLNAGYNVSGIYTIYPDGINPIDVYCDMTTDGGGWTLVLNYLHKGNTNPNLKILTVPPLQNSITLGNDESLSSTSWGHLSNAAISKFTFTETMWYGKSSFHDRVIHFKNHDSSVLNYIKTGVGSMQIYNNSTNLNKYSNASLPNNFDNLGAYEDKGDYAMTEFPFYGDSTIGNPRAHWGIKGLSNRWEVDDYPSNQGSTNYANDTLHQIWIR